MDLGHSTHSHFFFSSCVRGAVGFVVLWTLTSALIMAWCWPPQWVSWNMCGRSNVDAVPCSSWHAFCSSTVPGAVGFVIFQTLTSVMAWGWRSGPENKELSRFKKCGRSNNGAVFWSPWHVLSSPSVPRTLRLSES